MISFSGTKFRKRLPVETKVEIGRVASEISLSLQISTAQNMSGTNMFRKL